jgi:hypothetical protein
MLNRDYERPKCEFCDAHRNREVLHRTTNEMHKVPCPCLYALPVSFAFQKYPKSCMAACVAMISGQPEEKIIRDHYNLSHDFTEEGSYLSDALAILDKHYQFVYQSRDQFYPPTRTKRDPWPALWGTENAIYLASVRNLRDSGKHGVVVLPDGTVLDPAAGIIQGLHRYPEVYDLTAFYRL